MSNLATLRPQSWKPGQSGNPKGKPKGTKHVSTWVNEMLNDETFTVENFLFQGKTFKGAPIKAIMQVAAYRALEGDVQWAKWLTDNATKLDALKAQGTNVNVIFVNNVPRNTSPQLDTQSQADAIPEQPGL